MQGLLIEFKPTIQNKSIDYGIFNVSYYNGDGHTIAIHMDDNQCGVNMLKKTIVDIEMTYTI